MPERLSLGKFSGIYTHLLVLYWRENSYFALTNNRTLRSQGGGGDYITAETLVSQTELTQKKYILEQLILNDNCLLTFQIKVHIYTI